jgi:hypothetical protein
MILRTNITLEFEFPFLMVKYQDVNKQNRGNDVFVHYEVYTEDDISKGRVK